MLKTISNILLTAALLLGPSMGSAAAGTATSSPDLLMTQGAEAFQRGAFDQAVMNWKQAAELYAREGKIRERIQALVQLAHGYQAAGQLKQALPSLELALALAQQSGDSTSMASVLAGLGRGYLAAKQADAASPYLNQALEMAKAQENPRLMSVILNDLGILRATQGEYADSFEAYSQAARLAENAGDSGLTARARLNAGRAAMLLGRHEQAKSWLDRSLESIEGFPPSHDQVYGLMGIALAYQDLRPSLPSENERLLQRASSLLQEAASVAERIGDIRGGSFALGHLGHLYETEHRYDEALHLTRQAVFSAQSVNAPESLYRWQWQTGRILATLGQLDEAIAAYRSAAYTLQPIRVEVNVAAESRASNERESVRALFFELADLLLQRAALTEEETASEVYLHDAQDAVEAFKAAELRDYFRDECVDAFQANITKLEKVSTTTAVIYPIIFSDRIELLVSLPIGLKRFATGVPSEVLTKEIRAFRKTVERRTTREYLPHAQQLYDWLIRPLLPSFAKFRLDTLVFVPDGPLRTIPMAALHDGSQFLISKYAIAMTPGLSLTDPRPINREKIKVLSTGLTEAVQGFPALPHVAEELRTLRTLYRGDQLLNQEFVTTRLEQELREGQFGALHIATHGHFAPDVNQTFLLTFDGKLSMNQLDRLVGLFRFRQDPLELLTLSACRTGVGDDRAALGLAGVAIKAGARSALATLWFISDQASSVLVSEFYRQLQDPSVSKAIALQRAQHTLLEDRVYAHPAYWSPFLLLNNWL